MYENSKIAKQAGWHSRRNQTSGPQMEARETRRDRTIRLRQEAGLRKLAREQRTDEEQLKLLEDRGHRNCGEAMALQDKIREGR